MYGISGTQKYVHHTGSLVIVV